jgi:hypothetical protein
MSLRLPSNISASFPKALSVNEWADIGIKVGLIAIAVLSLDVARQRYRLADIQRGHLSRMSEGASRLAEAMARRRERDLLDLKSLRDVSARDRGRADALTRLTSILPLEMTLRRLVFGADDAFEIVASLAPGTDLQAFRRDLFGSGFLPADPGGWAESGDGRQLVVRGSYGAAIAKQ